MQRIAHVHNYYQHAGGEDEVFAAEQQLLASRGHYVAQFTVSNELISSLPKWQMAKRTVWNAEMKRELAAFFSRERPEIAHFHNTFPLLSPAVYSAAKERRVPVVQTLHNFRLICPGALLFRDGHVCEACLGRRFAWPAVLHSCYRHDRAATAVTAVMVWAHSLVGTWRSAVHRYIALSEFSRQRFIAGGLPADRVVVKPNFLAADPGLGEHSDDYALFVGRLSEEKGLRVLLEAWSNHRLSVPLKIVGNGPLESLSKTSPENVEWCGWRDKATVIGLMKAARVLIVPSICYENFPMTIVEAFATGLPVITTGHGSLKEIVVHGKTGWHTAPQDAASLASAVDDAFCHRRAHAKAVRETRHLFEQNYSAEANYRRLVQIYDEASAVAQAS